MKNTKRNKSITLEEEQQQLPQQKKELQPKESFQNIAKAKSKDQTTNYEHEVLFL